MPIHTKGLHHYQIRKRIYQQYQPYPHPDTYKRIYDKIIYITVIVAPILNIPQLSKVWIEQDASGVSPISWFGFSFISITWLIYGILHKDMHIFIMNVALMLMQILIAVGAVLYG